MSDQHKRLLRCVGLVSFPSVATCSLNTLPTLQAPFSGLAVLSTQLTFLVLLYLLPAGRSLPVCSWEGIAHLTALLSTGVTSQALLFLHL